jgi:ABC-type nickel/cobalt efflux system permease component RcnA
MNAQEFAKVMKDQASDSENLWLLVASLVLFPLMVAWVLWRLANQAAAAFSAQALSNAKQQFIYNNQVKELQDRHQQQMKLQYQQYMAQREKRLLAYEKLKASQAPDTSAPAPSAQTP